MRSHPKTVLKSREPSELNQRILRAFKTHGVPATGFVIEQSAKRLGLPQSQAILKQWAAPGFDLGNHFYSHADTDKLSTDQIEAEILQGETTIAALLQHVGRKPQFLRFPYNHTGDTQQKHDTIAAFLVEHHYRLAPCTIESQDYLFDEAYALALAHRDPATAARVRAAYLAFTAAAIDWYTQLDAHVFGYEPPHIMLLHDNSLNADSIDQVLALFEQRQYRFVTLAAAEADPAYVTPETYITSYGPMWGYRWAQEKHVKVNGQQEPEPPAWITRYIQDHPQAS